MASSLAYSLALVQLAFFNSPAPPTWESAAHQGLVPTTSITSLDNSSQTWS